MANARDAVCTAPPPRPRWYTLEELEDITETVRQISVLANDAPGIWIKNADISLYAREDEQQPLGTVFVSTSAREEVEVVFQPVFTQ